MGSTPRTCRPPPSCAHVTVPKAHSGGDGAKDPPELSPFPGNTGHPGWDCGAALGSSGLEWKLPVPGVLTRESILGSIHQGKTCAVEGAEPRVGRARLTMGVHTGKGGLAGPPEQPQGADR